MGSTKVRRSKTLPWPPVILAMMSLPQMMKQMPVPIRSRRMTVIIIAITLRFLDLGFLAFGDFFIGSTVWLIGAVEA